MLEIGSEFWPQYEQCDSVVSANRVFLLSGRTALRFIIDDICNEKRLSKCLLPSYCCESMILPFMQSGIQIQFYHVDSSSMDYPIDNDADVVVLLDYFGYTNDYLVEIAHHAHQSGKIVIYDSTHKIDGNPMVQSYSDYSFCSFRKWFYCNFATATKHVGSFSVPIPMRTNDRYLHLRDHAAGIKKAYIGGLVDDKNTFLREFAEAETILDCDYIGYNGSPISFRMNEVIEKRRENALYLIRSLKHVSGIRLWRNELHRFDTPMFVPILLDPSAREDLRSRLISEQIYCPIHWPKPSVCNVTNSLYDAELSLICDQRYNISDMERMVQQIIDYLE